jgi:hypothetical protein
MPPPWIVQLSLKQIGFRFLLEQAAGQKNRLEERVLFGCAAYFYGTGEG